MYLNKLVRLILFSTFLSFVGCIWAIEGDRTSPLIFSNELVTNLEPGPLRNDFPDKGVLAVYFENDSFWRGSESLKKMMLDELQSESGKGRFSKIVEIHKSETTLGNSDAILAGPMNSYRRDALRCKADAVLVVSPGVGSKVIRNPFFFFDVLTLSLTGLFVPMYEIETTVDVNSSIWDVSRGSLYVMQKNQMKDTVTTPLYWAEGNASKSRIGLKVSSLKQNVKELTKGISLLN